LSSPIAVKSDIIELQNKSAHQEYLLQQLNDALVQQQEQIDALTREVKHLRAMLRKQESHLARPEEEAPPPHY
jgi:SlyX protein